MSKTIVALVGIIILSAGIQGLWSAPQPDNPAVLLRAAIEKEEVDGDLNAAIEQYKQVIRIAGANRAVAAQALLRLGGCFEKRGPEEARRTYQQLIRDYGEQGREVAAARARLAALQPPGAVPGRPEMTIRRVLTLEFGSDAAAIDSRATFFSFTDWDTGDLAIRELPGGDKRRLTNKGSWTASSEFTLHSFPSPDGRHVAYDWWTKDSGFELRVVGLDGSEPKVIHDGKGTSNAFPCGWSPDGTLVLAVLEVEKGLSQLVLLSVAGAPRRVITTVPGGLSVVQRAGFSPDGRYIAFDRRVKGDPPQQDVFVVTADGSRTTPLIQHAANDEFLGWSPDGRFLLFSSDRAGRVDAWLMAVAGGLPQGVPQLIKRDLGRIVPDGLRARRLVPLTTSIPEGANVYMASVDPASGKLLAPPRLVPERFFGANQSPDWSPDGRYLLYLSRRGPMGPAFNIPVIRSMETGETRDLATKLMFLNQVRWSLDGRSLLGVCFDRQDRRGICRIDAQTGQSALLVESQADFGRLWPVGLADGKHILFFLATKEGQQSIQIRNLDTGEEREVVRVGHYRYSVSPDGRQLAYQVVDSATKESVVKVMPVAGGESREVFRTQQTGASLSWTADGRQVLVGRSDPENEALWLVPADGGKPLRFTVGMKGVEGPRLNPDGHQVVFYTSSPGKGEVWVMENFLPPAKR